MTTVNTQGYTQDEQGQWWKHFRDGRKTRARLDVCTKCGHNYPTWRPARAFCSVTCARLASRVTTRMGQCAHCRQEFEMQTNHQQFCSHSCAATAMHAAKPVTTLTVCESLKNSDDVRYSRDAFGQWWYRGTNGGRTRADIRKCVECGDHYLGTLWTKKNLTCSHTCGMRRHYREHPGETAGVNSALWKGGKIRRRGYVLVYAPDHPTVQGTTRKYVLEHRLVLEQKLGRLLYPYENIHHLNGIRDDNRPENLELWEKSHPPGQRADEKFVKHCPTCTCGTH